MLVKPAELNLRHPKGFVVLEGVNGAGKSTLLRKLEARLQEAKRRVLVTFEPGATSHGKEFRKLLLESGSDKLAPTSELLLFAADRHEHVAKMIRPALARRDLVLCDRFLYSTVAFQGYGRGLDQKTISALNELAVGDCLPDLVLLLDLDPEEGLRRAEKRRSPSQPSQDSFEAEELGFHRRLRAGFLELARERPEPFILLDGAESEDVVFEEAWAAFTILLKSLPG